MYPSYIYKVYFRHFTTFIILTFYSNVYTIIILYILYDDKM